ncbi:MAG: hypothetical protein IJG88_05310, partial [Eggerthellaceae bacterium]|nr:hypothetical protein [Eggerthellaceae bacterium]
YLPEGLRAAALEHRSLDGSGEIYWDIDNLYDSDSSELAEYTTRFFLDDGYQKLMLDNGFFKFVNIEDDLRVIPTWTGKAFYMALVGDDGELTETTVKRIEEPKEAEEKGKAPEAPKTVLPKTGDAILLAELAFASAACGLSAFALLLRTRREDEAA